jgi:hypothetical protein
MTERKFYRHVIMVEVLSEEPYNFQSLEGVEHAITSGDCSGTWTVAINETIDAATCAKQLMAQGSDPEFFRITPQGEETDNDDDHRPEEV